MTSGTRSGAIASWQPPSDAGACTMPAIGGRVAGTPRTTGPATPDGRDERTASFARCGVARVDEWADAFRVERRLSLPRAAVPLAVDAALWREPPRQQHVADLPGHLGKRVSAGVSRGPLARFVIGRTTPRVGVASPGTALRPAEAPVDHVPGRTDAPLPIDLLAAAGGLKALRNPPLPGAPGLPGDDQMTATGGTAALRLRMVRP